jgi:hypothetical protein
LALQQPVVAPIEATPTPPTGRGSRRWRPLLPDAVVVVALLVGFGLAHDLSSYLADPYWLDEAWVALSVRASWSDLPYITSSTPLGFSALLRLVPDQDALRLVPLVFNALTVVAGYALGRLVRVGNRLESMIVGVVCAGFVLLLPAQQVRHDLKQYTPTPR